MFTVANEEVHDVLPSKLHEREHFSQYLLTLQPEVSKRNVKGSLVLPDLQGGTIVYFTLNEHEVWAKEQELQALRPIFKKATRLHVWYVDTSTADTSYELHWMYNVS